MHPFLTDSLRPVHHMYCYQFAKCNLASFDAFIAEAQAIQEKEAAEILRAQEMSLQGNSTFFLGEFLKILIVSDKTQGYSNS